MTQQMSCLIIRYINIIFERFDTHPHTDHYRDLKSIAGEYESRTHYEFNKTRLWILKGPVYVVNLITILELSAPVV